MTRTQPIVDTELLNEYISNSGLKKSFIIEQLGISRQAFSDKSKGKTPFRKSEVYVLCDLLGIKTTDKAKIFYPESKVIA